MKRALIAVFVTLSMQAQTHIASDVEIRQMEETARRASDFDTRVAAHVSLAELHIERNESAAAQREFASALQLARDERERTRREHELPRYALACAWSGLALAGLGRGSEAFADFEEGVRYDADSSSVWNLYSVGMFRLRELEKAIGAARMSVAAAERKIAEPPKTRELLELNVDRFALAEALIDAKHPIEEAESVLRKITQSLDSDAFRALRKDVGKHEEFQIVAAATTENGMYLSSFNRSHMRLAQLYESTGEKEKARHEYEAVVSRRSDEAGALAGLARLANDPKERDKYLTESLDANPFEGTALVEYERLVNAGQASPVAATGSVGSRVRLAMQQIHDRDYRRARATLQPLLDAHPNNDVLQSLLDRTRISARPWFLEKPADRVMEPSEFDLRALLALFDTMSPADRATLDKEEFSSQASVDGDHGLMQGVPFRFQSAVRFHGIAPDARLLRLTYRVLGATTVDGRDALLIEPIRAEAIR